MNKISFKAVAATRRSFLLAAAIGTLALTSCATSSRPSLPVQGGGKSGSVSGVRIYESNGKVMVVGSARPAFPGPGNHVDVKLVGPGGCVVAEKTERIKLGHPRGARARHGSDSFVASFPIESARGATAVVVSYHNGSPSRCEGTQG